MSILRARLFELVLALSAIMAVTGIAVPMLIRAQADANRLKCLDNLRKIGEGIKEWSLQHDYALPPGRGMSGFVASSGMADESVYPVEPGLNALWDKGRGVIRDPSVFVCPGDPHAEPPPAVGEDFTSPGQLSYGMTGYLYPTDAPNKVIVADKSDSGLANGRSMPSANHGHRFTNVLFFDGGVRTCNSPVLPPGVGSEMGSIYVRETGDSNDTFIE